MAKAEGSETGLTCELGLCCERLVSSVPYLPPSNDTSSMNTHTTSRLDPSSVALRLGMCAAALAGTAGMTTDAQAVIVNFNTPIAVPNTFAGVYINLMNGVNGTTPGAVLGWDFGPYGSSNALTFFWNSTAVISNGGVAGTTTGPYLNLPLGSVISATSTFAVSTSSAQTTAFQTTGTRFLGFRFFNELTTATNYGYLTMQSTGPSGFPATITGWSFENSGGAITVVPEPSTALMLSLGALALGAANLRRIRRQGRQLAS